MGGDADYLGLPTSQRVVNLSEPGLRPVLRSLSHAPIVKMLSFDQLKKQCGRIVAILFKERVAFIFQIVVQFPV